VCARAEGVSVPENGTGCGDVRERGGQQGWGCACVQGKMNGMGWEGMDDVQSVPRPDI
jgi:hypothetical protein